MIQVSGTSMNGLLSTGPAGELSLENVGHVIAGHISAVQPNLGCILIHMYVLVMLRNVSLGM